MSQTTRGHWYHTGTVAVYHYCSPTKTPWLVMSKHALWSKLVLFAHTVYRCFFAHTVYRCFFAHTVYRCCFTSGTIVAQTEGRWDTVFSYCKVENPTPKDRLANNVTKLRRWNLIYHYLKHNFLHFMYIFSLELEYEKVRSSQTFRPTLARHSWEQPYIAGLGWLTSIQGVPQFHQYSILFS